MSPRWRSSTGWRAWFGALSERELALFLAGRVASLLGSSMAPVAVSFAILAQHGTATQLGEVLAAQSVPLVAFLLIGGGLADRWGRRMVMVVADLMRVAAQGSLGCWILLGHPPLWAFASAEAVVGLGTALFAPASTGLVPELVTNPDHLQQANSLRGLATSLATVVGPAAAGVIVAAVNPGWAVVADSISYAVSAGSLLMLHLPAPKARSATSFMGQLRDGWSEFWSRTWLSAIVGQYALFHLIVLAPFMVLGVVIAKSSLGGATAWGAILAALGFGSLLGSLIVLRFRPRYPLRVATLSGLAWILPMVLLGVAAPAWSVALGALVAGMSLGVFGPLWDTTLQREVPERVLSSVSAYDYLGSVALLPVGYAIAGPLSAAIGARPMLLGAGVWVGLSSLVVLGVPAVRQLAAR